MYPNGNEESNFVVPVITDCDVTLKTGGIGGEISCSCRNQNYFYIF